MKESLVILLAMGIFSISACASVQVVQRDAQGGTLALRGMQRKATSKAYAMMNEHCGGRYQIVEEQRMKAGEETNTDRQGDYGEQEHTDANTHGTHESSTTTRQGGHEESTTTTTTDIYEKWLTYRCAN